MGTCIVAQAAEEDPRLRALVLLAPFTRLDHQLRHQFRNRVPGVAEVAVWTARWHGVDVVALDTEAAVSSLRIPIQIIGGGDDHAIPTAMPERLAQVAENANVWIAEGIGHVGFASELGDPYLDRIATFFDRSLGAQPPDD
jgi:pimeloyl-ACP methyl ester carboxylesterase